MDIPRPNEYLIIRDLGIYLIRDEIFFVFQCDRGRILIRTRKGEDVVFVGQNFLDAYAQKLPENKLLKILWGLK